MRHSLLRAALCVAVAAIAAAGLPDRSAQADSIYDARVEQQLKLTSSQRQQVRKILAESERQATAVFNKYGIDPNGRPVFDQLRAASGELMAIARRERQAMKRILSPEQLDQYDQIIDETRIRVRKAAQ